MMQCSLITVNEECLNSRLGKSIYCSEHTCKLCPNLKLTWAKFCSRCICPDLSCKNLAYTCNKLCICCYNRHGDERQFTTIQNCFCKDCRCIVCLQAPKMREDHISKKYWGLKLLCNDHKKCMRLWCPNDIKEDSVRYCHIHVNLINQIIWVAIALERIDVHKDIIKTILQFYRWKIENKRLCYICRDQYVNNKRSGFRCDKCIEEGKKEIKSKTRVPTTRKKNRKLKIF